MVDTDNEHENGTVTTDFLFKREALDAAIGARLTKTDVDLDVSVCRGYTG
jgi:hypothetical protein